MKPLNILYLHSHDTGRYVAPYGYHVPTPHLRKFAGDGVMFRQAFCANPTCSPSRASLLTGMYAHSCGMLGLAHRGFAMSDYSRHLAHHLARHGYVTALAGIQHEIAHDRIAELGYQNILTTDHGYAHLAAASFLYNHRQKEPFFLSCGFFETHRNFPEPAADEPLTTPGQMRPPAPIPDAPQTRQDMAAFNTSARTLDDKMHLVLQTLEQTGLADNTLVIITTDHGPAFPAMKCQLTDHGIGVMLMLRCPALNFTGGKISDALVSHVDLFPTICDLAGLPKPDYLQGRSMTPLLTGNTETIRDEVFAEVNWHAAYEPMRAVRTQRYKLIRRHHGYMPPVLPNCDGSPSKDLWLANGWRQSVQPREALYDVLFDPNETQNLVDDPAHADALRDLRGRLDMWMQQTGDPLLAGPLSNRPGYIVNPQDGLHPDSATAVRY